MSVGLNTGDHPGEATLSTVASTGLGAIRLPLPWRMIEPREGEARDWSRTDRLVAGAARAGVSLEMVVAGAPDWALRDIDPRRRGKFDTVPSKPGTYASLLAAAVARYGRSGSFWKLNPTLPYRPVVVWQVWNEPNLGAFGGSAGADATKYAALLQASITAARRVDPLAQVMPASVPRGGTGNHVPTAYLTRLWKALGVRLSSSLTWNFNVYLATPTEVTAALESLRRQMDSAGLARAPMALTEFGWNSSTPRPGCVRCAGSEAQQAARASQALKLLKGKATRLRLSRVRWYKWRDGAVNDTDGLTDLAGRRKPVLEVLSGFR